MAGKTRNEDLSVYFFVKDTLSGKVDNIVDSYPYTEIINQTLTVPTVSVEHRQTEDDTGTGEMGASWYRRTWAIDIFAENDTKRDDVADLLYDALDVSIPLRDYSLGFRENGKSLLGADLRIIEYVQPEERTLRPIYAFSDYNKLKYWRATITFSTISTQAS